MKIMGLQKLTLLDYPGKIAACLFLGGCDMACPYCHNAELLDVGAKEYMSRGEFFEFLKGRRGFLDGVCVSGGEPLINKDLKDFLKEIKDMGFLIKLDTNGSRPDHLKKILDSGLINYLAMDIKNDKAGYDRTAGKKVDIEKIDRSISLIMEKGLEDPDFSYEFRTTVTKKLHSEQAFENIAKWVRGAEAYYLQAYQISTFVPDKDLGTPSEKELETYKTILEKEIKKVEIRSMAQDQPS